MKWIITFNTALFSILISLICMSPLVANSAIYQTVKNQGLQEILGYMQTSSEVYERIELLSEALLGSQYGFSPLGEGLKGTYDQDPLFRLDQFDCTTFVETVLAVALYQPKNLSEVESVMNSIRYGSGMPSYIGRNHFMSVDWLPHMVDQGILLDETIKTANSLQVPIHSNKASIDKVTWYQGHKMRSLNLQSGPDQNVLYDLRLSWQALPTSEQLEVADSKYIRFDEIPFETLTQDKFAKAFPDVSVVNLVLDSEQKNIVVVHQGLLIKTNNGLMLRHAKNRRSGVVEENFLKRLKFLKRKSKAKGFNVFTVNSMGI